MIQRASRSAGGSDFYESGHTVFGDAFMIHLPVLGFSFPVP